MTKTSRGEERERKRGILCCENFFSPTDKQQNPKRNRNFSLPEVFQPESVSDDEKSRLKKRRNTEPLRRHSWSSGINSCGFDYRDICRPSRKSSQDSRVGTSIASIPDIIEECSSDDESKPLAGEPVAEMTGELRCRYCFQKDSTVMIVKTDTYPYCKKCRDLLRNKKKYGNMLPTTLNIADSRKTVATDYLSVSPPRRMRKTSLPESLDLPCIEEPVSGEEASDTKELQLMVEKEVQKLMSFGCKGGKTLFYNHKRRNSDNDLDLITVGFKKMLIHKNSDLIQ